MSRDIRYLFAPPRRITLEDYGGWNRAITALWSSRSLVLAHHGVQDQPADSRIEVSAENLPALLRAVQAAMHDLELDPEYRAPANLVFEATALADRLHRRMRAVLEAYTPARGMDVTRLARLYAQAVNRVARRKDTAARLEHHPMSPVSPWFARYRDEGHDRKAYRPGGGGTLSLSGTYRPRNTSPA